MQKKESSITIIITGAIIFWAMYSFAYIFLKNVCGATAFSGYFALVGEVGLDGLATALTFNLWRELKGGYNKKIAILYFISFVFSIVSDCTYNVILNLFNMQYINPFFVSLFDIPFSLFLLFQLAAWSLIFISNGKYPESRKSSYVPYVIVSALMFLIFMFGIRWKIEYLSLIGVWQIIDTLLEVSGFALATICLARARTWLIRFVATGYLIVVSSDFIIRYQVVSGLTPHLSPFETTWIFGLLFMCIGFFLNKRKINMALFQLLPVNSLQSQIAIWLLILWLSSVLLLAGGYYMLSQDSGYILRKIVENLSSVIVPFSVLIIITSSYLATKISSPLAILEDVINDFIKVDGDTVFHSNERIFAHNELSIKHKLVLGNKLEIYEIDKLDKFIMNTINELCVANRVKSDFLMNMSHDFRTPASGIYNMARSISKRLDDSVVKQHMQLIVDSSGKLLKSLEDVLDYSRLDNGQYTSDKDKLDIREIVDEVAAMLLPKAVEKGIKLEVINHIFIELNVGGRVLIHRVILNVVSNAVKFTYKGSVTIKSSIHCCGDKRWLTVIVKDTGIGIDGAHHQSIFEPFYRVQSCDLSSDGGIGLGLSNVKAMLKNIGGRIEVVSKLGHGSEFTIFIPLI